MPIPIDDIQYMLYLAGIAMGGAITGSLAWTGVATPVQAAVLGLLPMASVTPLVILWQRTDGGDIENRWHLPSLALLQTAALLTGRPWAWAAVGLAWPAWCVLSDLMGFGVMLLVGTWRERDGRMPALPSWTMTRIIDLGAWPRGWSDPMKAVRRGMRLHGWHAVKGERRMLRKHGSIAILHDLGFVLIHDDPDHTPEAFPDRAAKAWIRHVDGPYPMQDVLPPDADWRDSVARIAFGNALACTRRWMRRPPFERLDERCLQLRDHCQRIRYVYPERIWGECDDLACRLDRDVDTLSDTSRLTSRSSLLYVSCRALGTPLLPVGTFLLGHDGALPAGVLMVTAGILLNMFGYIGMPRD